MADPLYGLANVLGSRLFVKLPLRDPPANIAELVYLVSGANTGLGFETCLHLSRMGLGTLVMAVRSVDKGEAAKQQILAATGRPADSIQVWPLDLADYASVRALAHRAAHALPRLDAVLANAGVMTSTFRQGPGGFEDNIQINVVSTFLLCLLLLPTLRASRARTGVVGHLVTVNSTLHYVAPYAELEAVPADVNLFEGLNDAATARMADRYALSKALVLYGVRELAARDRLQGRTVVVNTANPSFCKSGLMREDDSWAARMGQAVLARATEAGSRALLDGLFSGAQSHGQYLNNCHVGRPACHITSTWGRQMQKRVFTDLLETLERIEPGIANHV